MDSGEPPNQEPSAPGPTPRSRRSRRPWTGPLRLLIVAAALVLILRLTGCMERLFYYPRSGPTPVPQTFDAAEGIWFESGDGTRLYGWFIPAQTAPTGGAPTIIHVHGNAGNIEDHLGITESLPDRGFNLFIFAPILLS